MSAPASNFVRQAPTVVRQATPVATSNPPCKFPAYVRVPVLALLTFKLRTLRDICSKSTVTAVFKPAKLQISDKIPEIRKSENPKFSKARADFATLSACEPTIGSTGTAVDLATSSKMLQIMLGNRGGGARDMVQTRPHQAKSTRHRPCSEQTHQPRSGMRAAHHPAGGAQHRPYIHPNRELSRGRSPTQVDLHPFPAKR